MQGACPDPEWAPGLCCPLPHISYGSWFLRGPLDWHSQTRCGWLGSQPCQVPFIVTKAEKGLFAELVSRGTCFSFFSAVFGTDLV